MIRIISQNGKNDINYANHCIYLARKGTSDSAYGVVALPSLDAAYKCAHLGEYPTRERAEEVLKKLHDFASGRGETAVHYFPMPKE